MVFAAGDIDYRAFQTVVYRTDLITDPDTLAVRWRAREPHPALDRAFAVQVGPRGSTALSPRLNRSRFAVAKERVEDREEVIGDTGDGLATVHANVFAVDGHAFEQRLNALAATVCDADSYTKQQWRADAMGALAAGAERLRCQCGKSDCPAGGKVSAAHIVLHLVAEQATIDAMSDKPGYVPSAKLAEFVRCGGPDLPGARLRCPGEAVRHRSCCAFRQRSSHACIEFSRSCHREALGMGR